MTATTNSTTLPLSQLRIDPKSNVRHINRGLDPVLLASIKAVGLLTPLSVRPNGKGYLIYAGGQRFLALSEIAKENKTPDMPVPVIISEDNDAKAREKSLHENVGRSAMHPVDEYRAYALLASDKEHPMSHADIATRFGVSEKGVAQRLALGDLDDSILNAWQAGELSGSQVKLFTMVPNKKAQKDAFERARLGYLNDYNIRSALGLNGDRRFGKLLDLVTEEAYRARGGSVTRDLFAEGSTDHTSVSDTALLSTMGEELLDAEVARLQAEGWGTVTKTKPDSMWDYPKIDAKTQPTKDEAKRLKEIEKALSDAEEADEYVEGLDELEEERDAIQQTIDNRALASIDKKVKAKGIAFVTLDHNWSRIEIEFRKPKPQPKATVTTADGKTVAKKNAAPEDAISQALLMRQAEQLTAAAQAAVTRQPQVAMAILIAGITSNDDALGIHQQAGSSSKLAAFDVQLAAALKLSTGDQIKILTELVSANINLVKRFKPAPVLSEPSHRALVEAIDGKALTAATREKFDAKDYFASVSRSAIVEAVREAMGDDHAKNVEKMGKADAAKFATDNLPKLKWLPTQLRVPGYDGPAKKAAPAKSSAKKAPAKKAAAKKAKR